MRLFAAVGALALAGLSGLAAPARAAAAGAAILVEVNGTPITQADLDEALAMDDRWAKVRAMGSQRGAEGEIKKRIQAEVLESLIDEVLVNEAIRQARIALTPEEEREVARRFDERVKQDWGSVEALEQYMKSRGLPAERLKTRHRNGFLVTKLLHEEASRASFVRPADIHEHYESHKDQYQLAAALELSVVQVNKAGRGPEEARVQIEAAKKDLEAGKPFAEVARKHPDGPNADAGGHSSPPGGRDGLSAEWRAGIAGVKAGETSPIFEVSRPAPGAYVIVRIDRETPASFRSFEEVQDEIYDLLEDRARLARKDAMIRRLRERAFIKRK